MSFNANGTFYPPSPEFPAVAGEIIYAEYFNTIIEDIADALSIAYIRDGRAAMTGNVPMGGYTVYGLGNGTLTQPAIRFQSDIDTGIYSRAPVDGGGHIALVVDGVEVLSATANSVTINNQATFNANVLVPPYLVQNAGVL